MRQEEVEEKIMFFFVLAEFMEIVLILSLSIIFGPSHE